MKKHTPLLRTVATCIALTITSFSFAQESLFETPPTFPAEELVPAELISGEHHTLQSPVEVVDYSYLFKVDTPFGHIETWGSVEEFATLVREIEAIAILHEIKQTEAFTKAFSEALKSPVVGAWNAATHPIQTITGLPGGVSRYLRGAFYKVRKISETIGDKTVEMANHTGEKNQNSVSVGQRATAVTIEAGKGFLGYYTATRQWAQRLKVDPYSYNIALQESLGQLGWASTVGSFAGKVVIPYGGSMGHIQKGINVVWENDPTEVERLNVVALRKMGVSRKRIREFNEHKHYSLTEKTMIVLALKEMSRVKGHVEIFKLVLGSESQRSSLVMVKNFSILEQYHRLVTPIKRLDVIAGMLAGYTAEGKMILPVAIEYLHWTSLVESLADAEQFDVKNKELWIAGVASDLAQENYSKRGWKLQQKCMDRFAAELQ